MKVKVNKLVIKLHPFINPGIKDRRYKSGYRVLPYAEVNTEFEFTLDNPEPEHGGRFRVYELLSVGDYGKYIVVAKDGINHTVSIKAVTTSQFITQHTFIPPDEVEVLPIGFTVPESSEPRVKNFDKITVAKIK